MAITSLARFDNAYTEIVQLASRIIDTDKVDDPNEIAFLFRSLNIVTGRLNVPPRHRNLLLALGVVLLLSLTTKLRGTASRRPPDWPLIQDTEAAGMSDDFALVELRPSKRIMFHGEWFTTNRWGMRDREYEKVPAPGTYRIVLLGPSYVMGSGVADDEPFEALLEERLNQEHTGEGYNKYEILNFGVAGHTPLAELWLLENTALSFKPNALFFVAHHLEEAKAVRHLASRARRGMEIPYDYLRETARQAGIQQGMGQAEAERRLEPYSSAIIFWTYHRLVSLAQQHGMLPVWIYLLPPETGISEEVGFHLTTLATEAGFSIVNLAHAYANHDLETLIVAKWDRHPNAQGHQLIADHLYIALQRQGLIPGDVSDQIETR